jgi:hypothetical protein
MPSCHYRSNRFSSSSDCQQLIYFPNRMLPPISLARARLSPPARAPFEASCRCFGWMAAATLMAKRSRFLANISLAPLPISRSRHLKRGPTAAGGDAQGRGREGQAKGAQGGEWGRGRGRGGGAEAAPTEEGQGGGGWGGRGRGGGCGDAASARHSWLLLWESTMIYDSNPPSSPRAHIPPPDCHHPPTHPPTHHHHHQHQQRLTLAHLTRANTQHAQTLALLDGRGRARPRASAGGVGPTTRTARRCGADEHASLHTLAKSDTRVV